MGLSDFLPSRFSVMSSRASLVAFASARQDLPGSSTDLSTRAVPNHPGRSDGCSCLLLHHRLSGFVPVGGLATFVFLSRPNRVHLRYGSRVRLPSSPASLLRLTLVRLHVEQAIYTVNSFQFTRSARLSWLTDRKGALSPTPTTSQPLAGLALRSQPLRACYY